MISRRLFLALSGVSLLAPVIPGLSQELKDETNFITLREGWMVWQHSFCLVIKI